MSNTIVKFPISTQSTEALMVVFKTQGVAGELKDIFEISVNNSEYIIRIGPSLNTNKNILTLTEFNGLYSTEGRIAELYVNGRLAPINNAEIPLNQWTSLIIRFLNPVSSDSLSYFSVKGVTKTNISLFSSYSLPLETSKELAIYNSWDEIDNVNWNNYSSSDTWIDVFASILDVSSSSGIGSLWETFLGRNIVVQQVEEFSIDDDSILETGEYQYKTYLATKKESLYQNPA
jgi:hypothetical protein